MTIAHPAIAILAAFSIPVVMVVGRIVARALYPMSVAYSNLEFLTVALRAPRWPNTLLHTLAASGLALLVLGAAGVRVPVIVSFSQAAIVICIDTSGSMATADVFPTRAHAALRALRTLVDTVPRDTRIGIVSFAGFAEVEAMPTADRLVLRSAIAAIPRPNGQTAIGDALHLALRILPPWGRRLVVLMTDGINNHGMDPDRAVAELRRAGVQLDAIGIGNAGIDERTLRAYAQAGRGSYGATLGANRLGEMLQAMAGGVTRRRELVDASPVLGLSGLLFASAAWLGSALAGRPAFWREAKRNGRIRHRDDAPRVQSTGRDGNRQRSDRAAAHLD